jgi:hypothetical protein
MYEMHPALFLKTGCYIHRGVHSLFQGSGMAGKGSVGRSTVVGARMAVGTPCAGQTPVVSGSVEVERARRSTVYA